MSDFEWIEEPTQEELNALRRYKDDIWREINPALRSGSLSRPHEIQVQHLDSVIQKGRCTCDVRLYRAMSTKYIPGKIGEIFCDLAFLSTTLAETASTEFYPVSQPAKLIIEIPRGMPMAKFDHDEGGGEERERLLPRGTSLVVTAIDEIDDLQQILREQCTVGRPWLKEGSTLLKVQLRFSRTKDLVTERH